MEPTFGALPSPKDYRSKLALASVTLPQAFPRSYQTDISMLGVLDQKFIPACVAHAWVQVMKYWWYLKTGDIVDFSPRFLDILSWEDDIPLDGGRRPRTVATISKNVGCCTTALLPNLTSLPLSLYRDKSIITQAMRDEAAKYKIPGYIELSLDPQSIRAGIFQYAVVAILLNIGQEWWKPSWNKNDILPLKTPRVVVSGHQTVRYGWDGSLGLGLNEWGLLWADAGKYSYPESYWTPFTGEVLTIAELAQEVLDHIKTLPPPNTFKHTFDQNLQLGDGMTTPNDEVKQLQIALTTLGFFTYPQITGYYGPLTRDAVYRFQIANLSLSFMEKFIYRGRYFFEASRSAMNVLLNK